MAITLNWSNRNTGVTNFKVYRGTSPTNLALLTTLANTATSYVDSSASNNVLYYYRINAVLSASDEIPGTITPFCAITDTGPGPQVLARGNMEFGYFGTLSVSDFVSSADMQAAFPAGTAYTTAITTWYKMACNGKVLFIPNNPVRQTTQAPVSTLNALYNAGAMLGTGEATVPHATTTAGSTPVVQNKKVVFGSYEFYARLPKAQQTGDIRTNVFVTTAIVRETSFSEASMISSLTVGWIAVASAIAQGLAPAQLHTGTSSLISNFSPVLTQHGNASSAVISLTIGNGINQCLGATLSGSSTTHYVFGILELIPTS